MLTLLRLDHPPRHWLLHWQGHRIRLRWGWWGVWRLQRWGGRWGDWWGGLMDFRHLLLLLYLTQAFLGFRWGWARPKTLFQEGRSQGRPRRVQAAV